jgi:hypothetical protein
VPIVEPFTELVARAHRYLLAHGSFTSWANSTRDMALACKRAQVPRVTLRDLRRTFGRVLRARGVAPQLIGPMLRHSDSRESGRVAELHYAQLEAETLGRLVGGQKSVKL